jgi:isoleucyl-tRNA synthetase
LAADRDDAPVSVHLSDYPVADVDAIDPRLNAAMAAAREIVELGRRIRVETKTRTRQPLGEAVVHYAGDHQALTDVLPLVADELNVKTIVFAESDASFGRWRAKPHYKVLGPRLGNRVKSVANALADDDGAVASALAGGRDVTIAADDGPPIVLMPDDVDIVQEVSEGWGVASDGGITVALDLEITDDLRREGTARELVRAVQDARRAAGLDVSDRIALAIATTGDVAGSLEAFRDYVAGETLAVSLEDGILEGDAFRHEVEIDGGTVSISLRREESPNS